jgi:hypothetical protein
MWLGGRDSRQEFTQDRLSLRNDVTYSGFQMGGAARPQGRRRTWTLLGYEAIKELHSNPLFNYDPDASTTIPVQGFIGFGDPRIDRPQHAVRDLHPGRLDGLRRTWC